MRGVDCAFTVWVARYIALEERSGGDPGRVRVVYERALADCFWSEELWQAYVDFADRGGVPRAFVLPVHVRATRNCLQSGKLWALRLRAAERADIPLADLAGIWERARLLPLHDAEGYVQVCSDCR